MREKRSPTRSTSGSFETRSNYMFTAGAVLTIKYRHASLQVPRPGAVVGARASETTTHRVLKPIEEGCSGRCEPLVPMRGRRSALVFVNLRLLARRPAGAATQGSHRRDMDAYRGIRVPNEPLVPLSDGFGLLARGQTWNLPIDVGEPGRV